MNVFLDLKIMIEFIKNRRGLRIIKDNWEVCYLRGRFI